MKILQLLALSAIFFTKYARSVKACQVVYEKHAFSLKHLAFNEIDSKPIYNEKILLGSIEMRLKREVHQPRAL